MYHEQAKEMFSGFSTKTSTSVNSFPHADPAVRARMNPAHASVQRSLQKQKHTVFSHVIAQLFFFWKLM